jgi:DNA polymerase beta
MSKSSTQDYKQIIMDALDVLRKRDQAEKQPYKARAYQKVINQLKEYNSAITCYEDVKSIEGIGDKISEKIKEIFETGTLKSAERVKTEYNIDALDAFQKIYEVGPVKATKLINDGIVTIEQLRNEIKKNPKLLTKNQKIGLEYYEELLERIPYKEIEEHEDILNMLIPNDSNFTIEIVGSYRRGAETSGDIDVLIKVPDNLTQKEILKYFYEYINLLEGFGYIQHILALGEKKCMAISKIYNGKARRLDLLITSPNEYPYALLYFTGSDKFNVAFRQYAMDKGYRLNEQNMVATQLHIKEPPTMMKENDIFNFLKLEYIHPHDRIDHNQIIPLKPRKRPLVASY